MENSRSHIVNILWGLLLLTDFFFIFSISGLWGFGDVNGDVDELIKMFFFLVLPVVLPTTISFLNMQQNIYQEQGKILFKIPLNTSKIALISSTFVVLTAILVGLLFSSYIEDFDPFLLLFSWIMLFGPSYVLITYGTSFLICLAIYLWIRFGSTSTQEEIPVSQEQTVHETTEGDSIFHTLEQIVIVGILVSLAIFVLLYTDFLHWLLG